jgi:hypothetical protein
MPARPVPDLGANPHLRSHMRHLRRRNLHRHRVKKKNKKKGEKKEKGKGKKKKEKVEQQKIDRPLRFFHSFPF